MSLVHKSEREDFENLARNLGYLPADFDITEAPDNPDSAVLYAVTGSIQVKRLSTGVVRQYRAGHGSAWLPQFDSDLRQRLFGAA